MSFLPASKSSLKFSNCPVKNTINVDQDTEIWSTDSYSSLAIII